MSRSAGSLLRAVTRIYGDLDQQVACFQRATGLQCPVGCGACCKNPQVEATILEALPLAEEIYHLEKEAEILAAIQLKGEQEDLSCILYRSDPVVHANGRCTFYPFRPLVCRLFGFAARRNKYGQIEFAPCRIIKQETPDVVRRAEIAILNRLTPPLYQESFLRIAAVLPAMGFRRLPINRAIWEALAYLQWKKPSKRRYKKAA